MSAGSHVLSVLFNRDYPSIVRGEGVCLYDSEGRRFLDASSGPLVCSLGYGIPDFGEVLAKQAREAAFAYRFYSTTPVLERAAQLLYDFSCGLLEKSFFVSGGSEAVETAVKLARVYHMDNGEPERSAVIGRWMAYHGGTKAALSWGGHPQRRRHYRPYLLDQGHIPPAYCYRCWYGRKPEGCNLECARALEQEILLRGPETVAAFIAEPVSGTSLCAAVPKEGYFKAVRDICDRYGVLLILDEVMTGIGRTGRNFAFDHFGIKPDILVTGKALGGGYFPVGAASCTEKIYDVLARNSALFPSGYSWAGNPLAAAVICKTFEYMEAHKLVSAAAEKGAYLRKKLEELQGAHPSIGDIRGLGLMQGIEFVADRRTGDCFDPDLHFYAVLEKECADRGMFIITAGGCDRGRAGDMVMFGPSYTVTTGEIDEMVGIFDDALARTEQLCLNTG